MFDWWRFALQVWLVLSREEFFLLVSCNRYFSRFLQNKILFSRILFILDFGGTDIRSSKFVRDINCLFLGEENVVMLGLMETFLSEFCNFPQKTIRFFMVFSAYLRGLQKIILLYGSCNDNYKPQATITCLI